VDRVMEGRRILVTGAGGGIGGATADALAGRGAHVVCADVDAAAAVAAANRTGGTALAVDLADLTAAEQAVRDVAPVLHGIVHAAGIGPRTALPAVDEAEWARVLDVNLSAPFLLTQRLLDLLTGEQVVLARGTVGDGIRASSSMPGPCSSWKLGSWRLVDGAIINNVPVSVVWNAGADFIIGSNVTPGFANVSGPPSSTSGNTREKICR